MTTPKTTSRTTPAAPSLVTMADILAMKAPPTETVRICVDPALAKARDEAEQAAERAQGESDLLPNRDDLRQAATAARKAADAAKAAADAATVAFTFRALERPKLAALLKAHPPTAAEVQEYRDARKELGMPAIGSPQFNADTFPPALLVASVVEPAMTLAEANQLWAEWSEAETSALFTAAWNANGLIAS